MQARTFTDLEEAHAWLREQFGAWAERPTPQHLEALVWYKTGGSEQINGSLRTGDVGRFDAPAHLAITEAIAAETLTEPVCVCIAGSRQNSFCTRAARSSSARSMRPRPRRPA